MVETLKESPYFVVDKEIIINSIESLLKLSVQLNYGAPGELFNSSQSKEFSDPVNKNNPRYTNGMFRGQSFDWPLIPSCYRNFSFDPDLTFKENQSIMQYVMPFYDLKRFCRMAKEQNVDFPNTVIEQTIIAQHYGIKTPLLDWTKNVFVAIYFALDINTDEIKEPVIYHLRDEKLLDMDYPSMQTTYMFADNSFLVNPIPLDRRIDRQFSIFTYHPHPIKKPVKIPIDKYVISKEIYVDLWDLMQGLGFSSSHYFPDYAGLADRIKQGYYL